MNTGVPGNHIGGGPEFQISCHFEDIPLQEQSCWMNLVSPDVVLAKHFPIPPRCEEKGLEMSIDLLAKLCGIQHAIVFKGGVVMEGPTAMLLPISRQGDIIQWHLVVPENGRRRLSYLEGVRQCTSRALIDEVDLEALKNTRAIVGWWSEARTRLGDLDVNYENIDYSTAEEYEPTVRFSKLALGVQQFATAQFEATLGPKDSGYQMKWGSGAYEDTIFDANKMRVVLYDTAESRACFANGAEVILHMIRTRSTQRPFMIKGSRVDLPSEESVAETLLQHKDLELISDRRRPEAVETLVIRYFGILEDLLALDLGRKARPETAAGVPFQNQLIGHEFMALVDRMSIGHVKKRALAKTSGGWPQLVQDSDALTLFGSGFGDLIQPPSKAEGLCHQWRTKPKEKDYLGIKVETLLDFYKKAGCRLSREYLTPSHLKWHRDRVQEILASGAVGKVVRPRSLMVGGAVIFGRTSLVSGKRNAFAPAPRQIQASSFYGQANVSLESSIKGIEMEIERRRVSFTGEST
ncbi:hypothetical protein CKAH01_17435 [Colletotrichum kahawae]|uniref:Uncharacterized protein n=1 Tax=Colletotrichum kahawae TaxID=34407 RepID=A0AAD9YBU2_COLKA|nr:hypothetical protein CKAH01_17435 [Colletotrichum kahawae]